MATGKHEEGIKSKLKHLFGIGSRSNTDNLSNIKPSKPKFDITDDIIKVELLYLYSWCTLLSTCVSAAATSLFLHLVLFKSAAL